MFKVCVDMPEDVNEEKDKTAETGCHCHGLLQHQHLSLQVRQEVEKLPESQDTERTQNGKLSPFAWT